MREICCRISNYEMSLMKVVRKEMYWSRCLELMIDAKYSRLVNKATQNLLKHCSSKCHFVTSITLFVGKKLQQCHNFQHYRYQGVVKNCNFCNIEYLNFSLFTQFISKLVGTCKVIKNFKDLIDYKKKRKNRNNQARTRSEQYRQTLCWNHLRKSVKMKNIIERLKYHSNF